VETLRRVEAGTICYEVQDHSLATLAPILKREDGLIDFSRTAQQIYDRWRGFQPWPGAHTTLRGRKLIVGKMKIGAMRSIAQGDLLVEGEQMFLGCADQRAVELLEVQMEGKKRMSAAEFLRGYQVKSGERLGL
jgi:methionyl-tRNA formyltransferase